MTKVEQALREYPATRSNDRKLCLAVWWLQKKDFAKDEITFREFFLHTAVMPETITRRRRKLQEQGLYPASKEVDEERYKRFINAKYSRGGSV